MPQCSVQLLRPNTPPMFCVQLYSKNPLKHPFCLLFSSSRKQKIAPMFWWLQSLGAHSPSLLLHGRISLSGLKGRSRENGLSERGCTLNSKECEHIPQDSSALTAVFIMTKS